MNDFNLVTGMETKVHKLLWAGNQRGITLVLVTLMIFVLVGFMALAIDVGYYMVARNELQNIADGAALAACRQLGEIYRLMSPEEQRSYVSDPAAIVAKAVAIGTANQAGGVKGITIEDEDVIIGVWDGSTLTPTLSQPDAVRVTARRKEGVNGSITTFFARALGINTLDASADATAALTGQSTTELGELELPVGISSFFFQDGVYCNDSIVFNPTNDPSSCAGWTSYDISPPNDNLLRKILDEEVTSPETTANETVFNFIGGNLSDQTFDALLLLFMRKGYDITADGEPVATDAYGNPVTGPLPYGTPGTVPLLEEGEQAYYPDDKKNPTPRNKHRWETSVVVYDREDCSNPNTSIVITGYSKIAVTDVQSAPDKRIVGQIECDLYSNETTRGSGAVNRLVRGTIPGLVE